MKDIGRYMKWCDLYQRMKNIMELPVKKLIVIIQCSKCLSKELTLVLSNIRELNRVPNTK